MAEVTLRSLAEALGDGAHGRGTAAVAIADTDDEHRFVRPREMQRGRLRQGVADLDERLTECLRDVATAGGLDLGRRRDHDGRRSAMGPRAVGVQLALDLGGVGGAGRRQQLAEELRGEPAREPLAVEHEPELRCRPLDQGRHAGRQLLLADEDPQVGEQMVPVPHRHAPPRQDPALGHGVESQHARRSGDAESLEVLDDPRRRPAGRARTRVGRRPSAAEDRRGRSAGTSDPRA